MSYYSPVRIADYAVHLPNGILMYRQGMSLGLVQDPLLVDFAVHKDNNINMKWSPNGKWLAVGSLRYNLPETRVNSLIHVLVSAEDPMRARLLKIADSNAEHVESEIVCGLSNDGTQLITLRYLPKSVQILHYDLTKSDSAESNRKSNSVR